MRKHAIVDLDICDPHTCNPEAGICLALKACTHGILEQEEPFESPIILSQTMCVGCADCVTACPLGAIRISRGSY